MLGLLKAGIDGIDGRVKLHVKLLIDNQLKKIQSTKEITTLWVRQKKPVKSAITLDPKDVENAKVVDDNTIERIPRNGGHFFVLPAESRSNCNRKTLHCEHFHSGQLLKRK